MKLNRQLFVVAKQLAPRAWSEHGITLNQNGRAYVTDGHVIFYFDLETAPSRTVTIRFDEALAVLKLWPQREETHDFGLSIYERPRYIEENRALGIPASMVMEVTSELYCRELYGIAVPCSVRSREIDFEKPIERSRDEDFARVCLNSDYLLAVAKGFPKNRPIVFCVGGQQDSPIIFFDEYYEEKVGAVMPIRSRRFKGKEGDVKS